MTGPEHYREAERLLHYANRPDAGSSNPGHRFSDVVAEAQVHATLALTAATMDVAGATVNGVVSTGWSEAIS